MSVENSEHEALFSEIMRDFEENQQRGRDEGILAQIRAEYERVSAATHELQAENARREAMIAAQEAMVAAQMAENDRSERLARERLAEEERRASEAKRREIEKTRASRARVLRGIQRKLDSITDFEVLRGVHVDASVVFSANPNDDSLPLNFNTDSPEYIAWASSPAYDEFWDRVNSGEEDKLGDSMEL